MDRVAKNLDYLKVLSKCKCKMRKSILQNADQDLVSSICECIVNCLNGNISINSDIKEKIGKQKNFLRKVLKKNNSLKLKKQLLAQKGGSILSLILPTVISGLTSYLFDK